MRSLPASLLAAFFVATSTAALADCTEAIRSVRFGEENAIGLRTYLCRPDGQSSNAQVRVEFHRISDVMASVLFNRMGSEVAAKTIGEADVIENEVFKTFMDLLKRFGTTNDRESLSFSLDGPNGTKIEYITDTAQPSDFKTLGYRYAGSERPFFPAVPEFNAARAKAFPANTSYFYRGVCRNAFAQCAIGAQRVVTNLWRGLTISDIENYPASVRSFNKLLQKTIGRAPTSDERVEEVVPSWLSMARYVGGDRLPDDFVILIGDNENDGDCSDQSPVSGPSIGAWDFGYWPRKLIVETLLVENTSKEKIAVSALLGNLISEPGLRAVKAPSSSMDKIALPYVLEPGKKILIPTKVLFGADDRFYKDMADLRRTSADIQRRVGTNGFSGQSKHEVPSLKTYAFGPEISVNGLVIDGDTVSFRGRRSSSWADLYSASDELSCPFLLSWDGEAWVDHGKILETAQGRSGERSDARIFPGLRNQFRFEEREPELAHIDKAELKILLRSGAVRTLQPSNNLLTARDGAPLELFAGQRVELTFPLPEGISEDEVVTSEIVVTGYYDRYSTLLAQRSKGELLPTSLSPEGLPIRRRERMHSPRQSRFLIWAPVRQGD
jgi:hypothetical protein